jgi:hypothetical protein
VVWLVPLVDGQPRQVPLGNPTRYGLLQYLVKYQRVDEAEIPYLLEFRKRAWSAEEIYSVDHAKVILAGNARLLARYPNQVVVSPHPTVES